MDISELCAEGYQLDNNDRSFFKNSSQGQVDLFKKHVKETREKLIDYTKEFPGELKFKEKEMQLLTEILEHMVRFKIQIEIFQKKN